MRASVTSPSGRFAAAAFEQYVRARRTVVDGAVFFLESAADLPEVEAIAEPGDIVIAPSGSTDGGGRRLIRYEGRFCEPGDQMTLGGGLRYHLQDYLAAPFLLIDRPTVIRLHRLEGVAALLNDADLAWETGVFVGQLLSSAAMIDSHASFLPAPSSGDALVRIHVTAEGDYRDGPDGLLLGVVGDERAELEATAAEHGGPGRALARVVPPGVLEADLDDRPWFGRYMMALALLRGRDDLPPRPALSGFGGHLVGALDDVDAHPRAVAVDAPFLVTGEGDEYLLLDPTSGIRLRLGVDAARAAECLIATGEEPGAAALLASELGSRASAVRPLLRQLRRRLAAAGLDVPAAPRR